MGRALIIDPLNWALIEKEGKMEKKYLKKVLTGLSIASLVTGIGGLAVSASGWSGGQKSAGSTQEVKQEAPAPPPAPAYGKPAAATEEGATAAEEEEKTEEEQAEEKKAE